MRALFGRFAIPFLFVAARLCASVWRGGLRAATHTPSPAATWAEGYGYGGGDEGGSGDEGDDDEGGDDEGGDDDDGDVVEPE